ncbi:MAG TPA: DUF1810 domain-containing protein [Nevskiaceae bacterium]
MVDDPFNVGRFVEAQAGTYAAALAELRRGRKTSHWIWFVFPQLRELGKSAMSERYGISGLTEARAYLTHPLLGPRLHECVAAMLAHRGQPATAILGGIDATKFRSCLTLFRRAAPDDAAFSDALDCFYQGNPDPRTEAMLAAG